MDPNRLTRNPIFSQLERPQLWRLAALATEETFPIGKVLVREGDFSTELYIIEDGTAEVIRQGAHIGIVGPGDVVGEIGVIEKTKRTADVVVLTPLTAIVLSHWEISHLPPRTIARFQEIIATRRAADALEPAPAAVLD